MFSGREKEAMNTLRLCRRYAASARVAFLAIESATLSIALGDVSSEDTKASSFLVTVCSRFAAWRLSRRPCRVPRPSRFHFFFRLAPSFPTVEGMLWDSVSSSESYLFSCVISEQALHIRVGGRAAPHT